MKLAPRFGLGDVEKDALPLDRAAMLLLRETRIAELEAILGKP